MKEIEFSQSDIVYNYKSGCLQLETPQKYYNIYYDYMSDRYCIKQGSRKIFFTEEQTKQIKEKMLYFEKNHGCVFFVSADNGK